LLPVTEALGELGMLDGGRVLEARLVPQLGRGESGAGTGEEGWKRDRLFAAVAELLGALAQRSPVGLVIEDVHWADTETLDLLTFLVRLAVGARCWW
jgi:hypothetical protein